MMIFWKVVTFILLADCSSALQLESSQREAIRGLDFTFTCMTSSQFVAFVVNQSTQCLITGIQPDGGCLFSGLYNEQFICSCSLATNNYTLTIPGSFSNDSYHYSSWRCEDPFSGRRSNVLTMYIKVPITNVTLEPTEKTVIVQAGEQTTFNCTTDSGRPAAWIQWYIGPDNVTNQATPQPPQPDGNKFISSSTLVYSGKDADHNKVIWCEAVNIEGGQKVKSAEKFINILSGNWLPTLQITAGYQPT